MRRTIETLRSQFDRVIIDAPPTAPLADIGILTPLVDSVVLVVRAGVDHEAGDSGSGGRPSDARSCSASC